MTVSDACAEAMGYTDEANLRKLYIYRNGEQIEVDLRAIFQGDAKMLFSNKATGCIWKNLYGNKQY